jgi:hypothetical protein
VGSGARERIRRRDLASKDANRRLTLTKGGGG